MIKSFHSFVLFEKEEYNTNKNPRKGWFDGLL